MEGYFVHHGRGREGAVANCSPVAVVVAEESYSDRFLENRNDL